MTQAWDPEQYLKFGNQRLRPALDLLTQIDLTDPDTVYDLGCGPGNVTGFIQNKWPKANVIGVDSSQEMLDQAREKHPSNIWIKMDLRDWAPEKPGDLLYSNAVFQWIGSHETLLYRLLSYVRVGGVLAFQLPRNWNAQSHKGLRELAAKSNHRERLEEYLLKNPVGSPEDYYDLLRPYVDNIDIWETEYLQALEGENAVAEWVRGSALKPLLDVLDETEAKEFYANYVNYIKNFYPQRSDGKTLYPFRRVFVIARR